MDVRFSSEQVALRDAAVQLLSRLAPKTVADLDDVERAAKLDAAVDAAGWRELRTAGDDGAPWASGVECAIVAEELGRHLADTAFIEPLLAVDCSAASERRTALGLALTCADLVGVMRGAIDLATEYASARQQFGVPVGSFQAVQHLLADAFVAMEGSRSVALHAAWAVDALPPDEALTAASLAKAYCSRAARTVCETGIQVHGGIGNTWDCLAHFYLRRALHSIDMFGGVGASLDRVMAHHGIGGDRGLR
ncbi:MAG: acyl-CoA dehydrogenase [Actinobacteria bacterium]|nr:acyl-CoA dehydrogenase [Actinomycetota bacterium]